MLKMSGNFKSSFAATLLLALDQYYAKFCNGRQFNNCYYLQRKQSNLPNLDLQRRNASNQKKLLKPFLNVFLIKSDLFSGINSIQYFLSERQSERKCQRFQLLWTVGRNGGDLVTTIIVFQIITTYQPLCEHNRSKKKQASVRELL